MPVLLQIALGGALGSMLRYVLVMVGGRLFGANFPWGTLIVNTIGCFLIGVAFVFVLVRSDVGSVASLLMPGFLGGFTTFSAFALEAFQLFERGRPGAALAYAGGSVTLSLVGVAAGIYVARGAVAA